MSIIQEALKKAQADIETKKEAGRLSEQIPVKAPQPETPAPAGVAGHAEPARKTAPQAWAYIMLAVVLIAAFATIKFPRKETLAEKPAALPAAVQDAEKTVTTPAAVIGPTQNEPATVFKDMIPASLKPKPDTAHLVLNGIMYLEDGSRAIINNAIVAEGETVEGFVVDKINKKSVVLRSGDTQTTLNLK
jgi:hypothetical protein